MNARCLWLLRARSLLSAENKGCRKSREEDDNKRAGGSAKGAQKTLARDTEFIEWRGWCLNGGWLGQKWEWRGWSPVFVESVSAIGPVPVDIPSIEVVDRDGGWDTEVDVREATSERCLRCEDGVRNEGVWSKRRKMGYEICQYAWARKTGWKTLNGSAEPQKDKRMGKVRTDGERWKSNTCQKDRNGKDNGYVTLGLDVNRDRVLQTPGASFLGMFSFHAWRLNGASADATERTSLAQRDSRSRGAKWKVSRRRASYKIEIPD
ncbi:hypothetical protein FA13DRAFT_1718578 [Coprinellus micaceus]|uniref:Uncharacterized protein n=1 Tax=Coprinellus micaceus TaxID=71717 RepID=A0A4Y7SE58_COPMI|nr:hypothetical protein FA13DRAFT_1718578 [Coprinellus micaceus]